jgi:hypothetical protein
LLQNTKSGHKDPCFQKFIVKLYTYIFFLNWAVDEAHIVN